MTNLTVEEHQEIARVLGEIRSGISRIHDVAKSRSATPNSVMKSLSRLNNAAFQASLLLEADLYDHCPDAPQRSLYYPPRRAR